MHNAPSVSYPVGRCAFQRWLYLGLIGFTSSVLLAWALTQGLSAVWTAALSAAALGTWLGRKALRHVGTLTWDGQVWCLHDQNSANRDALGEVDVALDVQKALLLRWQPISDALHTSPRWLWLSSQSSSERWQDVRRAVYQHSDR